MVKTNQNPLQALGSFLRGLGGDDGERVVCRNRRDGGFELSLSEPTSGRSRRQEGPALLRALPFAAILPGDGIAEQVITTGLNQFLQLYNAALIGRLILTWFPNPPQAIVGPLATVCDPYLNLFRGIIPPLGGTIDLSPILAFIVLDLFSNSAAALPAELAEDGQPKLPERRGLAQLQHKLQAVAARRQTERARQAKAAREE